MESKLVLSILDYKQMPKISNNKNAPLNGAEFPIKLDQTPPPNPLVSPGRGSGD